MNKRHASPASLVVEFSRSSLRTPRLLLLLVVAGLAMGRNHAEAGVSLHTFGKECHELSERREGDNARMARLIIKSWVQGLEGHVALNVSSGGSNGALSTVFTNAEDPAWCAASIEKFLMENRASLPDDLPAVQVLPLWWMSVHPGAEPKHKELLQTRLLALKAKKAQSIPVRRFSK
ncbi:MAG: hypothetical protein V4726_03010 [Verrucomicrobiota bacterium]